MVLLLLLLALLVARGPVPVVLLLVEAIVFVSVTPPVGVHDAAEGCVRRRRASELGAEKMRHCCHVCAGAAMADRGWQGHGGPCAWPIVCFVVMYTDAS